MKDKYVIHADFSKYKKSADASNVIIKVMDELAMIIYKKSILECFGSKQAIMPKTVNFTGSIDVDTFDSSEVDWSARGRISQLNAMIVHAQRIGCSVRKHKVSFPPLKKSNVRPKKSKNKKLKGKKK